MFARREKPGVLRRLWHFLFPPGGLRRAWAYIWCRTKRLSDSPHAIAIGFAAGAFISFTPFIGFHFILAGLLAWFLRGSILASALGTGVGNPLTFPLMWWSTYNLGGLILGHDLKSDITINLPDGFWMMLFTHPKGFVHHFWEAMGPIIVPMMVGAVPIGGAVAVGIYFLVRGAVRRYQERRRQRLLARRQQLRRQAAE